MCGTAQLDPVAPSRPDACVDNRDIMGGVAAESAVVDRLEAKGIVRALNPAVVYAHVATVDKVKAIASCAAIDEAIRNVDLRRVVHDCAPPPRSAVHAHASKHNARR